MTEAPILIFDGECAMCSRCVRFVLKTERAPTLRFTAHGSEAARTLLRANGLDPDTINVLTLVEGGRVRIKSAAAIRVAAYLRAPWRWLGLLGVVPRCLLDPLYNLLAANRYRIMGRADRCEVDAHIAGRVYSG